MARISKKAMVEELAKMGTTIYGVNHMLKEDVERYYNTRMKEEENMKESKNMTENAPAPVQEVPEVTSTKPETTPAPKATVAQKLAADAERLVGYYTLHTNAKGHTYIRDNETGKTLAKVWATRKGVIMAPKADMVDTMPDRGWEYHPGWTSKFTLPLANMTEVWAVLDEYWLAKEEEVAE